MSPQNTPDTKAPSLAFWLESDNQKACEIARLAGFDIVVFDMEHGTLDLTALDRLLPFCQAIGLSAYVRLAEATRPNIQVALDSGADAIILPQLRDLAHAQEVTVMAKFAPLGTRGVGYSRTQRYQGADDGFLEAENRRLCYAMIETAQALADVAAIAALPCVDGLFMGPADLSVARGRGAFKGTDADLTDLATIAAAARQAGKLWAVPAAHPKIRQAALGQTALAQTADFVTLGDDLTALALGFKELRARITG